MGTVCAVSPGRRRRCLRSRRSCLGVQRRGQGHRLGHGPQRLLLPLYDALLGPLTHNLGRVGPDKRPAAQLALWNVLVAVARRVSPRAQVDGCLVDVLIRPCRQLGCREAEDADDFVVDGNGTRHTVRALLDLNDKHAEAVAAEEEGGECTNRATTMERGKGGGGG